VGEDPLLGYDPVTSTNRPVQTGMSGGVGKGREKFHLSDWNLVCCLLIFVMCPLVLPLILHEV